MKHGMMFIYGWPTVSDSPLTRKWELFCKLKAKLPLNSTFSKKSKKTLGNPNAEKNQDKHLVGITTAEHSQLFSFYCFHHLFLCHSQVSCYVFKYSY